MSIFMGILSQTMNAFWTMKIKNNVIPFFNIIIYYLYQTIIRNSILIKNIGELQKWIIWISFLMSTWFTSLIWVLTHFSFYFFQNDIFGSLNDSSLLSRASEALVAVDMKHPVSASQASQLANAAGAIAAGHISSAASQAAFSQIKVLFLFSISRFYQWFSYTIR